MRKQDNTISLFPLSERLYNAQFSKEKPLISLPRFNSSVHPIKGLADVCGYGLEDLALAIYRDPFFETADFLKSDNFEDLSQNQLIRSFVKAYTKEPLNRSYDEWIRDFPPTADIKKICTFLGLHPAHILPENWDDPMPPNLLRLHMEIVENKYGEYKEVYRELSQQQIDQEEFSATQFCEDNVLNNKNLVFQRKVVRSWSRRGSEEITYNSSEDKTVFLSDLFDPMVNPEAFFASEEVEEEQFPQLLHYFEQSLEEIEKTNYEIEDLKKLKLKSEQKLKSDITVIFDTDDVNDEIKELGKIWRSIHERKDTLALPSRSGVSIKSIFLDMIMHDFEEFGVASKKFQKLQKENPLQASSMLQRLGENYLGYLINYNKLKKAALKLKPLVETFNAENHAEMGEGSFLKRAYLHNLRIIKGIKPLYETFEKAKIEALSLAEIVPSQDVTINNPSNLPALRDSSGQQGPN